MHALELKIPPVAVVGGFALAMWLVALATPDLQLALPGRHALALVMVALGAGVALAGITSFARAKTTVNPLKPETATALVTSGIYRFTRNPMYLGFLMALLGWTAFLANPLSALLLLGFVLYMTRFQIIPEERALSKHFGTDYSAYMAKTRRWL